MRNLLVLTLLVSFMLKAEVTAGKVVATTLVAGSAAMSAVTVVYGEKARKHMKDNDGDSDLSTQASRLMMATEVFSGIGAGLLATAAGTLWMGKNGADVSMALSVIALVAGAVELTTSSVAYGLEDNHEYVFPDGARKKGSSDSNLKVAFGTSIANPFVALFSALAALATK